MQPQSEKLVYVAATLVFLPLTIVFGVVLLPVLYGLCFVCMYIPTQIASGRCLYACCPCLMMTRCCWDEELVAQADKEAKKWSRKTKWGKALSTSALKRTAWCSSRRAAVREASSAPA